MKRSCLQETVCVLAAPKTEAKPLWSVFTDMLMRSAANLSPVSKVPVASMGNQRYSQERTAHHLTPATEMEKTKKHRMASHRGRFTRGVFTGTLLSEHFLPSLG